MFDLLNNFKKELNKITTKAELLKLKIEYLGKKGYIQSHMLKLKDLSLEEKKVTGQKINELKQNIESLINSFEEQINKNEIKERLLSEKIDISLPGYKFNIGSIHPLNQIIYDLEDLFISLGYTIAEGPEIETDEYCFELLNLPKSHPARDMQDTFYINPYNLLRSQTSPVQVRTMLLEKNKPIQIICPGKTYRRDPDDATHSHQFMQCEGLVLGKNITMSDLKGALLMMVRKILGKDLNIRLRPSFFPFTEPSVEVDVTCVKCKGNGCNLCKNTGWIEILGAGMVNNNVLRMCGYNPDEIQGFAFGVGIERLAMLKYGIEDIRNFYTNDLRFLKQFNEVK